MNNTHTTGRDEMRVTMKNLNALVKPHGLEFVKGEGYFYFVELDGSQVNNIPDSIPVYALRQQTWTEWERDMQDAIKQSKGD